MADVDVLEDLFSNHNPIDILDQEHEEFQRRHRKVLHWDSPRLRGMRGARGHRPVKKGDAEYEDAKRCLRLDDYEVEEQEDGKIHCGDLVLATIPKELAERRALRRIYRANYRLRELKRGKALLEELSKAAQSNPTLRGVVEATSEMIHRRGESGEDEVRDEDEGKERAFIGSELQEHRRHGSSGSRRRGRK